MTVNVSKPNINIRSELADIKKPTGLAGEAMLKAETPKEQFNLIGAGRKNLIINGDMKVAERGTSHTTTSDYTLDRWKFQTDLLDQYAHTVTQSSDAPPGFFNSFKIEVTTTETSIESTEDLAIAQFIEAKDCQGLAYGTGSAKSLSLSFWVKSSVTGIFSVQLTTIDDNKIFPTTYTIDSANTWEYKTVKIPPCEVATIDNDSGQGLSLRFVTLTGSTYTTGDTGEWQGYNSALFAAGHVAQIATDGDTWQITGVQLEEGSVCTPFEYRSYGEELALCQRYFYAFQKPVLSAQSTNDANSFLAVSYSANSIYGNIQYPTTMRTFPSISSGGTWYSRASNNISFTASFGIQRTGNNAAIVAQTAGTHSANDGLWVEPGNGAFLY